MLCDARTRILLRKWANEAAKLLTIANTRARLWQSVRIWGLYAGAATLYLHAGLARLVASFPSSCISAGGDADALREIASWPSSTSLPELIARLLEVDEYEAPHWQGEKAWYGMGMPALSGALSSAALERLVYLDAQLAVPLTLTEPTRGPGMPCLGKPELLSEAGCLAQSLLRQFNASLGRLSQDSGEKDGAAHVAAAGVCRLVLARLPLVVSFCNDSGASARSIWKTLLSAAAAFRGHTSEGTNCGPDATWLTLSPYAEPIWKLLAGGGGSEGLYDVPGMHGELGAALIESLVLEVEALLSRA